MQSQGHSSQVTVPRDPPGSKVSIDRVEVGSPSTSISCFHLARLFMRLFFVACGCAWPRRSSIPDILPCLWVLAETDRERTSLGDARARVALHRSSPNRRARAGRSSPAAGSPIGVLRFASFTFSNERATVRTRHPSRRNHFAAFRARFRSGLAEHV